MSSTVKLALLVGVAIIAALILRSLFIAASAQPTPGTLAGLQRVRIAATDLPPGVLLRDSDLAWKDLQPSRVPAGAVVQGNPQTPDVAGAALLHPLTAGATITSKDVVVPSAPGFLAAALKPDMRAVSVAIDDVSGNAGLIQPGDYIDLILTQDLASKTDSARLSVASETVVNHVRVLAVGSEFLRPKDDATPDKTHARTVTLEVNPRTAEVVAISARLGTLSLALRSFATLARAASDAHGVITNVSDNTPDTSPPVWAGDVSRAVRALPAAHDGGGGPVDSAAPAVLVYRGSSHGDAEARASLNPPVPAPQSGDAPATPGGSAPAAAAAPTTRSP
ncbi:Flp pilus assembly protein CpaB [Paraburkholderia sediminicola]|uniref:Flp pilus assembly protein CpaB n=1 Tax=Paraburkholderia sediminicola TaxID=458836 RepID=UPI0038B7D41E